LIEYRAKLSAIAFIEYESQKGIKKRVLVEEVMEAFAATRDSIKDWKAELRVALGNFEVDAVLENAREFGEWYVSSLKNSEEGSAKRVCDGCEHQFGKPALLRAAKQYKARSKKS